jgi:hypothetical protein
MKKCIFPCFLLTALLGCSSDDMLHTRLEAYGKDLSASDAARDGLVYRGFSKVENAPMRAYVVDFTTKNPDLLELPDEVKNKASYKINTGRRQRWDEMFCTSRLQQILVWEKVDVITGRTVDDAGKIHLTAMCTDRRRWKR